MRTVVLISCVSRKLKYAAKAQDLYVSSLFKLSYRYAGLLAPDFIFILSAKHGLISSDDIIAPYNMTLNDMKEKKVKEGRDEVLTELARRADLEQDRFVFLAGKKYRKYLLPHIRNYEIPLQHLRIGEQLSWLKRKVGNADLC